ncbi:UNVERIFIED_CONTAM: hypothetical protein RMT77_018411 [Armadillidium vulgare]
MPPQTHENSSPAGVAITSPITKYPSKRDIEFKSAWNWLEGKREDDGVYPYWRIHDKLYDLSEFVDSHPGGTFWLKETQGMDITESFECSHFTQLPENLLKKFYVKDITTPRTTAFTFNDDGFFRTLKRKVKPIWEKNGGSAPTLQMKFIIDSLMTAFFIFMFSAARFNNYYFALIAGLLLEFIMTAAHNFFHLKDNWRMFLFDLSTLSTRDWRISHALSHHIYPNTIYDYEISGFEPVFQFLPSKNKSFLYSILLIPKICFFMSINLHLEWVKSLIQVYRKERQFYIPDLFPVFQLVAMVYINGSFWMALKLWLAIHVTANFILHFTGLQAAHHHHHMFHEGDSYPDDKDWGVLQVIATRERGEAFFNGPLFLIAISFGNHSLHHLFPTVCHSKLFLFQDVFLETCKEFGINYQPQELNPLKHLKGFWYCLKNKTPNKDIPYVLKKNKKKM